MAKTFEEMVWQLKRIEETQLVELLGLSSEDLVDRCRDIIEDKQEQLRRELQQYFEDDEEEE